MLKWPSITEGVTQANKSFFDEIWAAVEEGESSVESLVSTETARAEAAESAIVTSQVGQSTFAGQGAGESLKTLPLSAEKTIHSSNTAFGWHALKSATGLTGVFAPTSNTAIGGTVINLTGAESKAGPIWAGGTSNTPMFVFRKLPAGVTSPVVNTPYYLVSGTANAFSIAATHAGAPIAVAGATLTPAGTEIAFLRSTEDNTAIGSQAGMSLTTGGGNTLVGENAGVNLTTGEENTVFGCEALGVQQTGNSTVAIGFRAAYYNTTGSGVTAIGTSALENSKAVNEQTAVGFKAIQEGGGARATALGFETLRKATGSSNTAVGALAGKAITTGGYNTLVGVQAGNALIGSAENVLIGYNAGYAGKTGGKNVAVGNEALLADVEGERNTALGYCAGEQTSGSLNVFIGHKAGQTLGLVNNRLVIANNPTRSLIEGTMSEVAATQELGFYGVAPVKRHAAIASPAETLASLKTAVDALREAVKNIGITE